VAYSLDATPILTGFGVNVILVNENAPHVLGGVVVTAE
jgi:hypothetical protein